jgi:dTDP-4-amino-4,6-dideoxygalactose transaminase
MAAYVRNGHAPLAVTEALSAANLALPMSPVLSVEAAEQVVAAIASFAED